MNNQISTPVTFNGPDVTGTGTISAATRSGRINITVRTTTDTPWIVNGARYTGQVTHVWLDTANTWERAITSIRNERGNFITSKKTRAAIEESANEVINAFIAANDTILAEAKTDRPARTAKPSQPRADRRAATTSDENEQMRFIESGDTEQRELVSTNPNLTVRAIEFIVENWTFNPTTVAEFAALPNMTDDLRARIRTW